MMKGKQIGQGSTSEIYEYGTDKILKLYKAAMPKEACINEFRITQNIHRLLKYCPQAYEIVELDGRTGAVYEKITGKTLLSIMLCNTIKIKKLSRQLAHYHSAIQKTVDFELPSVHTKLKNDIRRVPELSDSEKEHVFDYIDTLPPDNILCHFDFHPGNIIMQRKQPIIIDWMTTCKGDKLADIARTGIMFKYAEIPTKSRLVRTFVSKFQHTVYKAYINEYMSITKTSISEIEKWEYPIMAARLSEWLPESEKQILLNIVRAHKKIAVHWQHNKQLQ